MAKDGVRLFCVRTWVVLGFLILLTSPGTAWAEGPADAPAYGYAEEVKTYSSSEDSFSDPDQAALLTACGLESPPMGDPFRSLKDNTTVLAKSWEWGRTGNPINHYRFSRREHLNRPYTNPICELFIMRKLLQQGNADFQRQRCEVVKNDFLNAHRDMQNSAAGAGTSTDVLLSFLADGKGDSDDAAFDICAENSDDPKLSFACAYLKYQAKLEGGSHQKQAATQLLALCKGLQIDMRPRMSMADYNAQVGGGVDAFGGGMCGNRGGPIILQNHQSALSTIMNGLLGATKVVAPIWAMWDLGKKHQANASQAIASNERLGFPSMINSGGGMSPYGGMNGYGGMGYGGCGGAGAGGCPFGNCGGNCGINAGMGGGFVQGGGMMGGGGVPGGICAVPPYAPWAGGGCNGAGGGIGRPYYGGGGMPGGIPGAGYPWNGGGLGGYGAGVGMGGGMPGGMPGYGAPGMGVGGNPFPGPVGTIGGTNGWGAAPGMGGVGGVGGYPGMYGGMNGGIGGNPFPGPAGTAGGTNGWGNNPWGANGMYGQPGYAGNQAFNAQAVQAQAQMYQEYAARIARQAQAQAQAATAYQQTLNTYQEAYQKSYQAYTAYQMASMGYTGAAQTSLGGIGAYGTAGSAGGGVYGYNTGYGNSTVPAWYPPYSSGAGSGRGNFSMNFNAGNVR